MIKFDSGNKNWVRISEQDNIFDNLNKTLYFLKKAKKDNSFWKWTIIAFHSALYSSMLLALRRTDLSNIWEPEIRDVLINHPNVMILKDEAHHIYNLDKAWKKILVNIDSGLTKKFGKIYRKGN